MTEILILTALSNQSVHLHHTQQEYTQIQVQTLQKVQHAIYDFQDQDKYRGIL